MKTEYTEIVTRHQLSDAEYRKYRRLGNFSTTLRNRLANLIMDLIEASEEQNENMWSSLACHFGYVDIEAVYADDKAVQVHWPTRELRLMAKPGGGKAKVNECKTAQSSSDNIDVSGNRQAPSPTA